MAQWKTAATASGRCICGVAWIEFNASRPVCGCKTTRGAAEVMGTRRPTVAPSRSKPTRRRARQACRRHQRDRSRPWRGPDPGEIDAELNSASSWSTSRPPHARRVGRRPAPGGGTRRPVWVFGRPLPRRSSGPRPRQPAETPIRAHDQGLVINCDLPEPSPSPFWPEGVPRPCQLRLCYRRWRLDWARARRVP